MTSFRPNRALGSQALRHATAKLGAACLGGGPFSCWGAAGLPAASAVAPIGAWISALLLTGGLLLLALAVALWVAVKQTRLQRELSAQLLEARSRADARGDADAGASRPATAAAFYAAPATPPAAPPKPPPAVAPPAVTPPAAALPAEAPAAAPISHESFVYTVAHDLRAPIRVVEGFTKIIKEDFGATIDAVGNAHLDRVLAAAARMNEMIDGLLAISRLSTQPLLRLPVDLSALATEVLGDLRRHAPDRDVLVRVEPGLLASGDPALLRVLIENLIGNAWKYTAKTAQARIEFERHPTAPDTFSVRDNGAGFDMRYAGRLFGVFQRLHNQSDFPGTGIGLASVQRIVQRHGGTVRCEAEVQRGASFHFSLPPAAVSPADAAPGPAPI